MDYKLMQSRDEDLIKRIFANRDVDYNKRSLFISPDESCIDNPMDYDNMKEGIELFKYHALRNSKIGLLVDPDVDGYMGNGALYMYLKKLGMDNITVLVHKDRKHGLTKFIMEELQTIDLDFLILVDSGSNDYEQHKVLKERGIDILVLDHHEAEKYSEDAIVINNQLSKKANRSLSGAGVCFKFLQQLDKEYGIDEATEYYDMIATSLIGDCMQLNTLENRYILKRGLANIKNGLLLFFLNKPYAKDVIEIEYNIDSHINAVTRYGDMDLKLRMFLAIVGELDTNDFIKTMVEIKETKREQSKDVEGIIDSLDIKGTEDYSPFCYCILEEGMKKGLSGLIASVTARSNKKPCLVLYKEDGLYKGSARTNTNKMNFRAYLEETGLFEYCLGHANAFGICITELNLKSLEIQTRSLPTINGCTYHVDAEYLDGQVSVFDIHSVDSYQGLWCRGFEEPLFYIKLKDINFSDVNLIGAKNDTIKIVDNYIQYMFFRLEPSQILEMRSVMEFDLEIIGKFRINNWNGRTIPQVIVEDYEIINKRDGETVQAPQPFAENPFFCFAVA